MACREVAVAASVIADERVYYGRPCVNGFRLTAT